MNLTPSSSESGLPVIPSEIARVLDANANRAAEGLRVLEDYFRFIRDDVAACEELKQLRHLLATTVDQLPGICPVLARNTTDDVGKSITAPGEYQRTDTESVLRANMQRVQQSLRCLEEFSKIHDPSSSQQFEDIRYRTYQLHQHFARSEYVRKALASAHLYAVLPGGDNEQQLADLTRQLMLAGVRLFQLRDKKLDDRELYCRAMTMRRVLDDAQGEPDELSMLIINDRADIARAVAADGVHVGQEELPVAAVREVVGAEMLIGVSTHTLPQALQAVADGADYLGCGPTFPGQTKQFDSYPGVEFLRGVQSEVQLPCFAIGGISLENIDQVLATGFMRVAVAGAITTSDNPGGTARRFLESLPAPAALQQA